MARNFNGSSYIPVGAGGVPLTNTAFSWVVLFNATTISASHTILGINNGSNGYIEIQNTGSVWFVVNGSFVDAGSFAIAASDGWRMAALTRASAASDNYEVHLYRFSTNVWSRTTASTANSGNGNAVTATTIGARTGTTNRFIGDIGAVAFYDYGLSNDQLSQLPYSLNAWVTQAPRSMWVLDQSATTQSVIDLAGRGNQTSLTGTTVSTNSIPILGYGHQVIRAAKQPAATGATGTAALTLPSLDLAGTGTASASATGTPTLPSVDLAASLTATRHNLCPNPAAGTDATGWSGTGTPVRSTDVTNIPVRTGVTTTTSGYVQTPTGVVAAGDITTISFYVKNRSGSLISGGKTTFIGYTRSSGGDVFPEQFDTAALGANGNTIRASFTTAAAPANATGIYLVIDQLPVACDVSAVLYDRSTLDFYFDGDSADASWDGTDDNSASSLVADNAERGTANLPLSALTLAGTATATSAETATAALTLPALDLAGNATVTASGTAALTLPPLDLDASATASVSVTGALTLPPLDLTGDLDTGIESGTAALTLPPLDLAGTATVTAGATAALTLPAMDLAASATVTASATAALTLPSLDLAGTGAIGEPETVTAALTLPTLDFAGVATASATITAAIVLPALTLTTGTSSAAKRRQVTSSHLGRLITVTSPRRLLDS